MHDMDKPITIRDLERAAERLREMHLSASWLGWLLEALKYTRPGSAPVGHTDYVRVRNTGTVSLDICKVARQPARRVQVGDLVTVAGDSEPHRVKRVLEVDVPKPITTPVIRKASAISPEDAKRIEDELGRV